MQGQKVPKKLTQKCKYTENKKSFQDEMKRIFYHFDRTFIEADGAAPAAKCKLNISSFLTLPHLLDFLICTSNSICITLLLYIIRGTDWCWVVDLY